MRRPSSSALLAPALALVLSTGACASTEAPPPKQPARPPVAAAVAPAPPAAPPPSAPSRLARADVDRVLTTQGPPWVLRRIVSEEVMKSDGKFAGWRLVGLPDEWRGIDLRPGDVVTRVNGLPLETPDQAWDAWKSVAKAPELKISLVRDGAPRELTLPIDGAPAGETTSALGRDPGPQRAAAPPPASRSSIQIGGSTPEPSDEDAY
jgi:S1-C subfamily serine protease